MLQNLVDNEWVDADRALLGRRVASAAGAWFRLTDSSGNSVT